MIDLEVLLNRWESAGVLNEEAADRIRAYEIQQKRTARLRWQGMVVVVLGAILLACGVVLFVSAHWDQLGPAMRYALVIGMVAVFHLAGALTHHTSRGVSTALHTVGTVSTGAAIAVVGQIFNIQERWPAAILLWALAALAGWVLLNDQAQEILALLLMPAWILSEFSFHADNHIGEYVYQGRFLVVWAVLYLTLFLDVRRKAVQGVLFVIAAIAAVAGIVLTLNGWTSWSAEQTFLPLGTRLWGLTAIALLPVFIACFRPLKSFIPVCGALAFSVALPWCMRTWTENQYDYSGAATYTRQVVLTEPNLLAYALVATFAIFLCWWGMHRASRALVNLGIVGFAVTVVWFYFSNIWDAVNRSMGLIFLGVLFLAGGWALEKTRRGLMAQIERKDALRQEAE
jgi:uncharacterized membrane protein